MSNAARYELRPRFCELDPYGHVNHATYLQYFEAARVVLLDQVGHGLDRLLEDDVQLVVTAVATRFVASAVLNDQLVVETGLVTTQRVRSQWAQRIVRGEDLIACQRVNFASVNRAGRPIRLPETLVQSMASFAVDESWHDRSLPQLEL